MQMGGGINDEVLKILAEGDDKELESKLSVPLLSDEFNRMKIEWCTRLAKAEGNEQKKKIEEEMRGLGPELAAIVDQLHAIRLGAKERQKNLEKSIREEARPLKDKSGRKRGLIDRDAESGWGQRQLLDLDSVAFERGDRLVAAQKIKLRDGSYKYSKKGSEEIHVPALKPKPFDPNRELVKISDMPEWAQPAFFGMEELNTVQSRVYNTALFKADNVLLCAPSGVGKANVAVLTILQQLALNRNPDGSFNHSNYKIVYIAPIEALVSEVVFNLSGRLRYCGVKVGELSGDHTLTHQQIEETQVIVTTPEKWDIIIRKSG